MMLFRSMFRRGCNESNPIKLFRRYNQVDFPIGYDNDGVNNALKVLYSQVPLWVFATLLMRGCLTKIKRYLFSI